MPNRTPSPEQRAQQQSEAIRADLLETLKAIDSHPEQREELFARHRQRVVDIVRQGRGHRGFVQQTAWHEPVHRGLPLFINLSWSLLMITVVSLVVWLTGGEVWPIALPLAFWVVFRAFVWTVGVPFLLFLVGVLFVVLLESLMAL